MRDFNLCGSRKAIIDASDADPAYARFDNDVVRSSIHYAFWHGACMYDVFQAMLTTIKLVNMLRKYRGATWGNQNCKSGGSIGSTGGNELLGRLDSGLRNLYVS